MSFVRFTESRESRVFCRALSASSEIPADFLFRVRMIRRSRDHRDVFLRNTRRSCYFNSAGPSRPVFLTGFPPN